MPMHIQSEPVLALLLATLAVLPGVSQGDRSHARPVAIVTSVEGEATAETPGMAKHRIRDLEWFTAGAVLTTGSKASLVVVFQNGTRIKLDDRSRFRVAPEGPVDVTGSIQELPAVPPLPDVGVVKLAGPASRINAVRVRADAFATMEPDGAAVLADAAHLEFESTRDFTQYELTIERDDGTLAFETKTLTTSIKVPSGVLHPGALYVWHIQALDPLGRRVRSSARFVTLTSEQVARRRALKEHFDSREPNTAFLQEIDRALGLLPPHSR
jgi:hypothetical protein